MSLFRKKTALHEAGDRRCPQCPDHWPLEHKNCGGLFHANSQTSPAGMKRFIACDRCGQGVELFLNGNIGSDQFTAELARQLERMILDKATSETTDAK